MKLFSVFFVTVFLFFPHSNAQAGFIDYPMARLQALDKATARTITFEARVGSTIEYGSVFIKVQACRKAEPLDPPEDAAFLQIWEIPINSDKSEWIFSGWMFASSPALSAMDHAVYDVWVLDCINKDAPKVEAIAKTEQPDEEDTNALDSDGKAEANNSLIEEE